MKSESLSEVHSTVRTDKKGWRKVLAFLGPAYLVSVGYMDPGNWATDIAGGSEFGYKLIWVLLMSNIMALLLQSLSARLGIVKGLDLAQASKHAYPKWANIPLYILAEIAIAACDLAEIVGMAIGLSLLFDLPLIWGVSITALDTFLLLFLLKKGMRIMEVFIISLIFIIGVSFVIQMIVVAPVYGDVVKGFVPSDLGGNALYLAIGIIGATVMPHNLYLHSSLVQTRKIDRSFKGLKKAIKYNFIDTVIALNMAFFVNAAILILAAAAFYTNGFYNVAEIQDASILLENLFGSIAPTFFAIALIAAGQSSTITGTLAGQIVMEGHLNLRIQPWLRRLITRLLAIAPALFTIIYFGEEALGSLLILSQVVLSLQLGFAVIPLIHFNSSKKMMGEFAIKPWVKALAWLIAGIIVYLNITLVIDEISSWAQNSGDNQIYIYTIVIPLAVACLALLVYVFIHPFLNRNKIEDIVETNQLPHGQAEDFSEGKIIEYKHIGITIDFSGNDNETQLDIDNLKQYQKTLESLGYKTEQKIGFGSAPTEIVKIVKESNIDMLVMGAHGHKGLKDLVFGTTLDAVRHKVSIPILIIS